jgi:hypothetical protein
MVMSALGALTVAIAAGCGGGKKGEVVARVAGVGSITKADLDHWTQVEFVLLHEYVPAHPAPAGVVPDPPSYGHCASYLRRSAPGNSKQSTSALKTACKHKEQELRASTLNKLISWDWTIGRAHALGLRASDAQVRQQLARVIKTKSLYGPNFDRYLKLSGQTMADILFRSRVQLFEVEMAAKAERAMAALPKTLNEKQRQLAFLNLAHRYLATKSWVAKTSCRKGYVVSACKQYTGSERPPGSEA